MTEWQTQGLGRHRLGVITSVNFPNVSMLWLERTRRVKETQVLDKKLEQLEVVP